MDLYIHLKIMTIPRPYKMTVNILFFALFLQRFLCTAAKCREYDLDIALDACKEQDGGTLQKQDTDKCIFSCNIDRTVCASASWYATWVAFSSGTQYVIGFVSYTSSSTSGATFTDLWTNSSDTRPRLTIDKLKLDNKTGEVHVSPSCSSSGYAIECHVTVCRSSTTPFPPTVPHPPTLLRSSATIPKLSNPIISLLIMTIISVLYAILLS
ncbi:m16 protein [Murid betaherpesvirus 1]|uniref:M16 protein n=1 Tax=Murid herpesvirus 1 TaxID=10366 RepID=H2A173_MUHV1|nr:m16 protein [Murid betaherpesvirus 1]